MEATDPLRPTEWSDFVGQEHAKRELDIAIRAALETKEALPHVLRHGRAGFGKTTMAAIIAHRLGDPFYSLSMGRLRPQALFDFFRTFAGGVVLIDEIHRASDAQQQDLLTLMEDGYMTDSRGRRVTVSWLTVVAATTERDKVLRTVLDRFPIQPHFDGYSNDEMTLIVEGMARRVGVALGEGVAPVLGRAAGGTPRLAKKLVLAARNLTVVNGRPATAEEVLSLTRIEDGGLTADHRAYLEAIDSLGGTAGIATLRMLLSLHESVLREIEKLLVERQLISYTDRGRQLEGAGYRLLHGEPARHRLSA